MTDSIEEWRKLEGFASYYEISSHGKIRNTKRNKILKLYGNGDGYKKIFLRTDDYERKQCSVHRLVAQIFIPNPDPEKLITVDHIDRVRDNNCVQNLRWACQIMQRENMEDPTRLKRKIRALNPDGSIYKEYKSIREAASDIPEGTESLIGKICRGQRKTCGGYKWEYADQDDLPDEQWIQLAEYAYLQVSNYGRLKTRNNRITKGSLLKTGYYRAHLRTKEGSFVHKMVHQLVAQVFLENPMNYEIVNHKDRDRGNNHIDNLEWCDLSHNAKHAYKIGDHRGLRPVEQISITTGETLAQFRSIREASQKTGISYPRIHFCVSGKQKTTGPFTWKYLPRNEDN